MINLIFATNNLNKVREVRGLLNEKFKIETLLEAGINIEIPEPYETLEENAIEKAVVINRMTGENCFAEDTGLQVMALNGEPGVKSARYAGEERSSEKISISYYLSLTGKRSQSNVQNNCLPYHKWASISFEGTIKGTIIAERRGNTGFGYDPVFIPEGSVKTFAEMTLSEKNIFSHRKMAIKKLVDYFERSA